MFFKKISPDCEYCKHGYILSNDIDCACKKYGLIQRKDKCGKFIYDPLKRKPKQPKSVESFSEEDFNINN